MSKNIVNVISRIKEFREKYGDEVICNDEYIRLKNILSKLLHCDKPGKMFSIVGETWNPITGCLHYCRYCWARFYATSKLRNSKKNYYSFKPYFHMDELEKDFKREVIFVVDMGDIFSPGVKDEWITKIISHISKFPNKYFLFLTKNPSRYEEFIDEMPENVILGVTIETNNDNLYVREKISGSPLPSSRYEAMKRIEWPLKFISIEPIIDFDIDIFTEWIRNINPFLVYIGYDNYEWRLPEPSSEKTSNLINRIKNFTCVVNKTIRESWNREAEIFISTDSSLRKDIPSDYEKFKHYLYIMHESALNIIGRSSEYNRKLIFNFFNKFYPTQSEHYWTLKKLFCLAMYIPMFLQIGISAVDRETFDGLVYIDTHAGPGLAKVGSEDNEIVLGSPLLALEWPKIISGKLKTFKKISRGFDNLFFIEIDSNTYYTLNKIVSDIGYKNVEVLRGDCNKLLKDVKEKITKIYKKPLILIFIDPFGEFSNQLLHEVFSYFIKGLQVDVIFNINARSLARGFEGKKSNVSNLEEAINDLWGDIYLAPNAYIFSNIFKCLHDQSHDITERDILDAYTSRFKLYGYKFVETLPIEYPSGGAIYHLLFASKSEGSYKWMNNYIYYLRTKAPKNYDVLKNLWLQATGKSRDLSEYIPRT